MGGAGMSSCGSWEVSQKWGNFPFGILETSFVIQQLKLGFRWGSDPDNKEMMGTTWYNRYEGYWLPSLSLFEHGSFDCMF